MLRPILQSLPSITTHDRNEIDPVNSCEVSNLSIENEMPQNSTQRNDDSSLEKELIPASRRMPLLFHLPVSKVH